MRFLLFMTLCVAACSGCSMFSGLSSDSDSIPQSELEVDETKSNIPIFDQTRIKRKR
ncbi:MAG: hypothetical protein ACKVH8_05330 [Pirellulales bacterium]